MNSETVKNELRIQLANEIAMGGKVRVLLEQADPKCGLTATSTPTWALLQS